MRLKQIYISIAVVTAGLAVQAVLALPATAATYETHGTATSTNLLFGSSASSITNFHYNLSYLPATSSVTIQFSNDGSTWYSAANVSGGSTTLSLSPTGGTDLSLSALGWSGTAFYYKMTINSTSDQSATPTIDDIRLDYTPTSGYENVFVFDNYGNVGIGTTSPSGKLDIHGAGTATGINTQWADLTGAAKVSILDNGNVGIGTTVPTGLLDIAGGVKIGAGYAGIGTTAPLNGLLVQGNVGIGTTGPGAKLVINSNTATPAVVDTATVLQIVGGAAANSRIENDAFGGYAAFLGRRADGTAASPTAVQANEIISRLDARGYGATGYSSAPRAMIDLIAGENWTDAAQGGYLSFSTTLNGGIITSEKVRIDSAGNVGIGTTSPGVKLQIASDSAMDTGTGQTNAMIRLSGATDPNKRLSLGFDTTNNFGYIQSSWVGQDFMKLALNPLGGNVGIGTTSPSGRLDIHGAGTTTGINTQWADLNGAAKVSILDNGNVGIGTTNPLQKLHVEGHCVTGDTLLSLVNEEKPVVGENDPISRIAGADPDFRKTRDMAYPQSREIKNKRIDQIKGGEMVMSLDEKTGKLVPAKIKGLLDMGVQPIYKITTEDGREIRTTGNHPYLTRLRQDFGGQAKENPAEIPSEFDGASWQKISNLKKGDEIAVPKLFVPQGGIKNDSQSKKDQSPNDVESGHSVEIKNHDIARLIILNEKIQKAKEIDKPEKMKPAFSSEPEKNGATIEAKNINPTLDNVSATSFNCESDSCMPSEYTEEESDVKFVKIAKIELLPAEQVWDIEVEGTHNFVAGHYVDSKTGKALTEEEEQNFTTSERLPRGMERSDISYGGIIAHNTYINGNVGIGTTNPLAKLDVLKTGGSAYERVMADVSATGFPKIYFGDGSTYNSYVGYDYASNERMILNSRYSTSHYEFQIAGSEKVRIDSTGNVGIGTTSPGSTLQVNGNAVIGYSANTGTTGSLAISGNVGIGDTVPNAKLSVVGNAVIGYAAGTATTANGLAISGNVGIGTTAPGYKLDVLYTTANSTGANAIRVKSSDSGSTAEFRAENDLGYSARMFKLGSTYSVYKTLSPNDIGFYNANAGNISILNDVATGKILFAAGAASTAQMLIDTNGNVGIGTTNPLAKLDVLKTGGSAYERVMADVSATGFPKIYFGDGSTYNSYVGYDYASNERMILNSRYSTSHYEFQIAGSEKVRIDSTGNVGIGTTSPGNKLSISGGVGIGTTAPGSVYLSTAAPDGGMIIEGNVGIGTTAPGYKLAVYTGTATGYVAADGSWSNASDVRLKKNISPISSSLEKVIALDPVTYNFKTEQNSDPAHIGFIAQDVEKIAPELVSTGPNGYMGISYAMFTPLLTKAIQEQQILITQNTQSINQQQTAIADVNLKTSQNVETVQQLQKSVDNNLTVISSNFSAVDAKLALQDSQMTNVNSQLTALDTKVSRLTDGQANIDTQLADLVSKYTTLDTGMSLSEAEKADLENRLTAAENSLLENENNLITFEKGTNDTLSAMLDTEDMLTDQVISQGARIKILEDKLAIATITAGGEIPANVVTQDALGNVALAGVFEAKEVVAGAFSVKNETGTTAPTMGDVIINPLPVDADGDGIDDATNAPVIPSDGKTVKISTKAVSDTSKIMVTPVGLTPVNWIVSSVEKGVSFTITLDKETAASVKFNWWIVEEK